MPAVYNGMPFVVCGRTEIRQCLHGPARKRHKSDQAKQSGSSKSCNGLQPSRKGSCPATMTLFRVMLFPESSLNAEHHLSARALKRKKDDAAQQIIDIISRGTYPVAMDRFYVSLATVSAHNEHLATTCGQAATRLSQRIHPELIKRIQNLVAAGLRYAREIQKLLKFEVSVKGEVCQPTGIGKIEPWAMTLSHTDWG